VTNRGLVCAALARGASQLSGTLRSDDTDVMVAALRSVGIPIESSDGGRSLWLGGFPPGGLPHTGEPRSLYVGNSGTTIRFLTAALSAAGGDYRLHGVDRMHSRPIGDLVDAIRPVLGGTIHAESPGGCPPVTIHSSGWTGDRLSVGGSVSSQYLSGLLMAAPIASRPVRISVAGELVSQPYVSMTADVMRAFGAEVEQTWCVASDRDDASAAGNGETTAFQISGGGYRGRDYVIEPDASAASYFWAAAAITGGAVTVEGLDRGAMQGDVGFCDVLERMGCAVSERPGSITVTGGPLHGIDIDMNAISDTVQTLSTVALFAEGPTRIRGVAHNRFKETDRIGDLACELRKLGAGVEEHDDGLTITPPPTLGSFSGAVIETYDDHRMAMSLALAGLRLPAVRVLDPSCTAKTYPDFFADLEALIGRPHRWAA
jgi:3-phosphoshikimate 1-carboxyvinyltransferase